MAKEFQEFISQRRGKLEAAEQLQQIAERFPEMVKAWATERFGINGSSKKKEAKSDSTIFDQIAALLVKNGNSPLPTPEINRATGATRGAIGAVLYKTHSSHFIAGNVPDNKKVKTWRLTDAALRQAKEAENK